MSTILKSLKRLETDKEKQFVQNQVSFPHLDTRHTVNRSVRFAWIKNRTMQWAIISLIIFLGISVLYAYYRPTDKQTQSRVANRAQMPAANSQPAGTATAHKPPVSMPPQTARNPELTAHNAESAESTMPQNHPDRRSESAEADKNSNVLLETGQLPRINLPNINLPKNVSNTPKRAKPDFRSAHSQLASKKMQTPVATKRVDTKSVAMKPTADKAVFSKPSEDSSGQPEKPVDQVNDSLFASAERMTDGRLKVQAIVWAPNNEERMAVVNNQVVREGATIDGFLVVGIGEEALFVRESGMRMLQVPFGQP